eukprot:CAMPEP_0180462808 /NCGR_PEP_ID=MMETSP1036_2-20121128/24601_1 /TAXON_ID=632150 /ORGANISM="Azadinium spinosum, Strain 3D9" /LENGTH=48 /DNA_ID= /DNA_START= /DNA_END= /DNA_ORIENTATION=
MPAEATPAKTKRDAEARNIGVPRALISCLARCKASQPMRRALAMVMAT